MGITSHGLLFMLQYIDSYVIFPSKAGQALVSQAGKGICQFSLALEFTLRPWQEVLHCFASTGCQSCYKHCISSELAVSLGCPVRGNATWKDVRSSSPSGGTGSLHPPNTWPKYSALFFVCMFQI